MNKYKPEGIHWSVKEIGVDRIEQAYKNKEIIEVEVIKCDENLNLYADLGENIEAIIPYSEIEYSPYSTRTKSVAIMSKVGKVVKVHVTDIIKDEDKYNVALSRASAQRECYNEYVSKLTKGDIIQAKATHIENYGIFCDIGCGLTALLPIENVSVTRILNPKKVLRAWKDMFVIIKDIDEEGKITLTHKELLGTWEQEASKFKVGETVPGIVKTIENYGVFIAISQNLSGLAETDAVVNIGDKVNVYIKDINSKSMKIKLAIVSSETPDPEYVEKVKFNYYKKSGHVDNWIYSPEDCSKKIYTDFTV